MTKKKLGDCSCRDFNKGGVCKGCPLLEIWDICILESDFRTIKDTIKILNMEKEIKVDD